MSKNLTVCNSSDGSQEVASIADAPTRIVLGKEEFAIKILLLFIFLKRIY